MRVTSLVEYEYQRTNFQMSWQSTELIDVTSLKNNLINIIKYLTNKMLKNTRINLLITYATRNTAIKVNLNDSNQYFNKGMSLRGVGSRL